MALAPNTMNMSSNAPCAIKRGSSLCVGASALAGGQIYAQIASAFIRIGSASQHVGSLYVSITDLSDSSPQVPGIDRFFD
jgi:hypothetical protein